MLTVHRLPPKQGCPVPSVGSMQVSGSSAAPSALDAFSPEAAAQWAWFVLPPRLVTLSPFHVLVG